MKQSSKAGLGMSASIQSSSSLNACMRPKNTYTLDCFDSEGNLKWSEKVDNLVTNQGLDDVLNKYFKGSAYNALFFVGLTGGSPSFAAGDTLASHAGWTEVTAYAGNRKSLVLGTVSGQSVDNSASRASFTINAPSTIGGAFIATVDTGTSGILYGEAAFAQNRSVISGDVINVTATLTMADAP